MDGKKWRRNTLFKVNFSAIKTTTHRKLKHLPALLLFITITFCKNSKFTAFIVKNAMQKISATQKKSTDHNTRISSDKKTRQFLYRRKETYYMIPRLLFFNTHP